MLQTTPRFPSNPLDNKGLGFRAAITYNSAALGLKDEGFSV